ncbi:MAG: TM2 domain-containing protein [Rhodobacterales bacterium]|nr:TM2 domain-containing protein [Rhodobacterales bacterium]
MKGAILQVELEQGTGLISGDDGNRYTFTKADWRAESAPSTGLRVDFTPAGDAATEVFADVTATGGSKRVPAALFAFFLGSFGAHKFYLGYKKQGLIMLAVFLLGFIALGIPSMIIGIIAFIEFVIYLIRSDEEFTQTYVVGRRGWF